MKQSSSEILQKIQFADSMVDKNEILSAIALFNEVVGNNPMCETAFLKRGIAKCKVQDWSGAMNDFIKTLEINEENIEAKNYLEMLQSIMSFGNMERYDV